MRKTLLLLCALLCAAGAWAAVTTPTLTTDPSNPTYYLIQNFRSGKYANYAGASAQLTQVAPDAATQTALWYFMENGEGVSIIPATDPSLKLATSSSATADGAVWYLKENPYNTGYFCVSLNNNLSSNCWDDQSNHTAIGYWQPNGNDYEGTSWDIIEIPITKSEVDAGTLELAFKKLEVLERLAPLSSFAAYTDANLNAVRSAADDAALSSALKAFETNITLLCRSGKYLVAGESACSFVESPTGFEEVIQLESVGDGTFYLKGYKSGKYIGQVRQSAAVSTTATPEVSFYFQNYNGYTVVRDKTGGNYAYIHNGGSGCVGWEAPGANTQHTMAEVNLPAQTVNVTYHIMVGGVEKAQATIECGVGDAPLISEGLRRNFTSYDYDIDAIAANTTDVYVTATWTGPFKLSENFANAQWQNMAMRSTWYVTSAIKDGGAYKTQNANTLGLVEDSYQWAFIGNPYDGFKIINKAEGDGKSFGWTDANQVNEGIPTIMDDAEGHHTWNIVPNTNGSVPAGSFCLGVPGTNLYINQFGGAGGSVKFWNNTANLTDPGSAFTVFDIPTNFASFVVDEIVPYIDATGYFTLTSAAKTAIGYNPAYSTECTFEQYRTMKSNLATVTADISKYILPETGYYRLESKMYPGFYMTYKDASNNPSLGYAENFTSPTSIIKLTKVSTGTYTVSAVGLYATAPANSITIGLADTASPVQFTAGSVNIGYGYFTTGDEKGAIHSKDNGYCVGWNYDAAASHWKVTNATSFDLTIGSTGYSTLWVPFAVTIPSGVTAYTGSINGKSLHLNEVEGTTLPANTAVVLAGAANTYTFNITDDVTDIAGNALLGSKGDIAGGSTVYALAKPEGEEVGFYPVGDGVTIPACKAYLTVPSEVKGFTFVFDDDATGIEDIKDLKDSNVIYNVAGQRIQKMQKGINIVNGKKIMVK